MKYFLSLLFACCLQPGHAQKLTLYGKILYYNLPETGLLYYSLNGEQFTRKQSITFTNSGDYSFSMGLAELRQKGIRDITFTIDTSNAPRSAEACVYKVHADEIMKHPAFVNSNAIRIHTDLAVTYFCETSVAYTASNEGNGRFTGSYLLQLKDTTVNVQLNDMLYSAGGMLNPPNSEWMDQLSGGWSYQEEQKQLNIFLPTQRNTRLGIILNVPRRFQFRVEEVNGQLRFQGDDCSLIKN